MRITSVVVGVEVPRSCVTLRGEGEEGLDCSITRINNIIRFHAVERSRGHRQCGENFGGPSRSCLCVGRVNRPVGIADARTLEMATSHGGRRDARRANLLRPSRTCSGTWPASSDPKNCFGYMIERRAALFRVVRLRDGMIYDYVSERSAT